MASKMTLRPVVPTSKDDADTLVQMRVACGWDALRVPGWMRDIETGKRLLWIIETYSDSKGVATEDRKGADPAGMIALVLENENNTRNSFSLSKFKSVQISSLFVYPQYRSGGLGTMAFLAIEEHAKGLGAQRVLLLTGTYENNNVPRYERLGYRQIGSVADWWTAEILADGGIPTLENSSATFLEKML